MSSYPVAAMYPPNESSILGGGDSDLSHNSNDSVSTHIPFFKPHLVWECAADSLHDSCTSCIEITALIDHGSPAVLIKESLVCRLNLPMCLLPHPFPVSGAIFNESSASVSLTHWVKLKLHDHNNFYSAHTVRTLVAPKLYLPIILGLPFLSHNNIVIDAHNGTVIDYSCSFDLLHTPHNA